MRARHFWVLTSGGFVVATAMSCWASFATAQSQDGPSAIPATTGAVKSDPSSKEESSQVAIVSTQVDRTDVSQCIRELASAKFDDRQTAHESLVVAGSLAIDALEKAAKTKKLEPATRCVEILHRIAGEKKNEAAAIAALERLAKHSSSLVASLAAQTVADFRTTDEERAIAALIRDGVRINRSSRGQVFSVTTVHDGQVALLKHLPGLRYVQISGKGITNVSIEALTETKAILNLTMMNCSVTDAGLKKMKGLKNLEGLSLYSQGNMITRDGLRHLKHIPKLKRLSLHSFNEIELGFLSELPKIDSLTLSNVRLNKRGFDAINQLENLKRLSLSGSAFDDERLRWCGQLDVDLSLSLSVMNSPKITDEGWKHLMGTRLQSLSIMYTSITDSGLVHIGKIKTLQTLVIYKSPVTDAGIEHLRELKSLRYLMLQETKVTEEGLTRLKQSIPTLKNARLGAIGRPRLPNRTLPVRIQKHKPPRLTGTAPSSADIEPPSIHCHGLLLRV